MLRRSTLVLLYVAFVSRPAALRVAFTFHAAACLLLHLAVRPFRSRADNALELASLALVMLTAQLIAPYPAGSVLPDAVQVSRERATGSTGRVAAVCAVLFAPAVLAF